MQALSNAGRIRDRSPFTYASIIQVLQQRNYVIKDRALYPEDRGRPNNIFGNFFDRYVNMTLPRNGNPSDDVSAGKLDWKQLLFIGGFKCCRALKTRHYRGRCSMKN